MVAFLIGSAFHPRAVIEQAGRQVREGPMLLKNYFGALAAQA